MVKEVSLFISMVHIGIVFAAEPVGVASTLERTHLASPASVKDDSFSLNYMWVNNTLDPKQMYVHPGDDRSVLRDFLIPILTSSRANTPAVPINVWYDSLYTSKDAATRTQEKLSLFASQITTPHAPITLKDIRQLVGHYAAILSDRFPIFHRVDFLRLAITVHARSQLEQRYFVYSDLGTCAVQKGKRFPHITEKDLHPFNKESLFDAKTRKDLDAYGIVMARNEYNGSSLENGFHVIDTLHPTILTTITSVILNPAYELSQQALDADSKTTPPTTQNRKDLLDRVYGCYPKLLEIATRKTDRSATKSVYSEMKNQHDIPFKS